MLGKLQDWLKQPTTIAGLGIVSGAITSAVAGQITWGAALGPIIGGIVMMAFQDNTAAGSSVQRIATALVEAAMSGPAKTGEVKASVTVTKGDTPHA